MSSVLNFFVAAIVEGVLWRIGAAAKKIAGRPLSETGAPEESIGGLIVACAMIGMLILQ